MTDISSARMMGLGRYVTRNIGRSSATSTTTRNYYKRVEQMTKKQRQQVYAKYSGHCAYCGKEISYEEMQVDHIKPKQRGWVYNPENVGTDTMDNYNPSCRACNFRKGPLSSSDPSWWSNAKASSNGPSRSASRLTTA